MRLMFALSLIVFLSGCAVIYEVPPPLTTEQAEELQKPSPFADLTVGIVPDQNGNKLYKSDLDNIMALFSSTHLFKKVFIYDQGPMPDLIVVMVSKPRPYMCATGEASLMIGTAGLVPVGIGHENYTYMFKLAAPKHNRALNIDFTFFNRSYMGSLSTLWALSEDWSTSPQTENNYPLFAYRLLTMKKAILNLVGR